MDQIIIEMIIAHNQEQADWRNHKEEWRAEREEYRKTTAEPGERSFQAAKDDLPAPPLQFGPLLSLVLMINPFLVVQAFFKTAYNPTGF